MRIGVPRETAAGECRVALVPSAIIRLSKIGLETVVESGAGAPAFIPDEDYAAAGAVIAS
ncbi:MAG: NAD(P)(+) transhydrogenase (Re/Si-specific) subunit alpha, partial [Gemmatimonadota bacterium]